MTRDRTVPGAARRSIRFGRRGRIHPRRIGLPRAFDQEAFLGVLSHELRTPVTTIYGGAQILATRDLPDSRRRALAADVGTEAELGRNPGLRINYLGASDATAEEADEALLGHVVRNLLDNATRYTAEGGTIEVIVDIEGDAVIVRVLDEGPEPSDTDGRDQIGPMGKRAGLAGGGLGLFVAERLVQAMNGRSWARPRPGGGAEFGFALQRSAAVREVTG